MNKNFLKKLTATMIVSAGILAVDIEPLFAQGQTGQGSSSSSSQSQSGAQGISTHNDKKGTHSGHMSSGKSMQGTSNSASAMFVKKAAEANLAEIELGQVALQNASSQQVKDFAQQMIDHHTMAQQELASIVSGSAAMHSDHNTSGNAGTTSGSATSGNDANTNDSNTSDDANTGAGSTSGSNASGSSSNSANPSGGTTGTGSTYSSGNASGASGTQGSTAGSSSSTGTQGTSDRSSDAGGTSNGGTTGADAGTTGTNNKAGIGTNSNYKSSSTGGGGAGANSGGTTSSTSAGVGSGQGTAGNTSGSSSGSNMSDNASGMNMYGDLPTELSAEHKAMKSKLSKLSGAEFDRQYMQAMVKDHAKSVQLFEKQANSYDDPALQGFASKTLPIIKQHYQMAQKLSGGKGNSGNNSSSKGSSDSK